MAALSGAARRFTFWREVIWRPVTFSILAPLGLLGIAYLFVLIRDEFLPPQYHERWRLLNLLHFVPWHWWIIATLGILVGVVLEGSFRFHHHTSVDATSSHTPGMISGKETSAIYSAVLKQIDAEAPARSMEATVDRLEALTRAPRDPVAELRQQQREVLEQRRLRAEVEAAEERLQQIRAEKRTDAPSIVVRYEAFDDEDDETGEQFVHEVLCFRNVGTAAATNITLVPFELLGLRVRLMRAIPALVPNEPETKVTIINLGDGLDRVRSRVVVPVEKTTHGARLGTIRIKMTLEYSDRNQEGRTKTDYVLRRSSVEGTVIERVDSTGPEPEWTDLAQLLPPKGSNSCSPDGTSRQRSA